MDAVREATPTVNFETSRDGATVIVTGVPVNVRRDEAGREHQTFSMDVSQRLEELIAEARANGSEPGRVRRVPFTAAPFTPGREASTPTPDLVSLEIERAIRESGLSKSEVARRLGVPAPAVFRLVRTDYHGHSVATLRRLADALGRRLEVRFVADADEGNGVS